MCPTCSYHLRGMKSLIAMWAWTKWWSEKYFLNLLENMLKPIYEIKWNSSFNENLIADFIHFFLCYLQIFVLEQRMGFRLKKTLDILINTTLLRFN